MVTVSQPVASLYGDTAECGIQSKDDLEANVQRMKISRTNYAIMEQEEQSRQLAKLRDQTRVLVQQLEETKMPPLPDPQAKLAQQRRMVAVLDQNGISLNKMHEISVVRSLEGKTDKDSIYTVNALRAVRKDLGLLAESKVPVKDMSDDTPGGWVSPGTMLLEDLRQYPLPAEFDTIQLNIGGDGRQCDRHNDQTILTMSVLNKRGHTTLHKLAVVRGGESYAMVRDAMRDLRRELAELQTNGLTDPLTGRDYNVELCMCTDWKFLRIVRGINHCGGQTKYFCVWCNKTDTDRKVSKQQDQ